MRSRQATCRAELPNVFFDLMLRCLFIGWNESPEPQEDREEAVHRGEVSETRAASPRNCCGHLNAKVSPHQPSSEVSPHSKCVSSPISFLLPLLLNNGYQIGKLIVKKREWRTRKPRVYLTHSVNVEGFDEYMSKPHFEHQMWLKLIWCTITLLPLSWMCFHLGFVVYFFKI